MRVGVTVMLAAAALFHNNLPSGKSIMCRGPVGRVCSGVPETIYAN
jgi:hypothetical protein